MNRKFLSRGRPRTHALLLLLILCLALIPAVGVFRPANAASPTINQSTTPVNPTTSITLGSGECSSLGGTWVGTSLCELSTSHTIGSGETLVIPNGITLTVLASCTLTNDGTITVDSGGEIVVMGAIDNVGEISNNGNIYLYGTVNGGAPGSLTNSFSIENYGNIYTEAGTTLTNSGTINNHGLLSNSGTLNNSGLINTSGTLRNLGTINNNGTINGSIVNSGTINNNGALNGSTTTVDSAWCINLGGTWSDASSTNYATCDLAYLNGNAGVIYTIQTGDTLIIPKGTALTLVTNKISVQGSLQNDGAIILSDGGAIINNGSFYNAAVCGSLCGGYVELNELAGDPLCNPANLCNFIDSSGTVYNYGDIGSQYFGNGNPGYGAIYNRGYFENYGNLSTPVDNANAGSSMHNLLSGSINAYIYNYGTVDNSGEMFGQAYVINEGGTFNNLNTLIGGFDNLAGTVNDYGYMSLDYGAVWMYDQYMQQYEYSYFSTYNYATFNLYQNGILVMKSGVSGPTFQNNGIMNLYGYTNDSGAIDAFNPGNGGLDNHIDAVINIYGAATIDIYGEFYNQGVVNNTGTINTHCGYTDCGSTYFQNLGTINNSATLNIFQGGSILNAKSLLNSGTITNYGLVNSTGSISESGRIYDYGVINNTGTFFTDSGTIDVYPSATIYNSGTMYVYSSEAIYNSGTMENHGTIYVYDSGSITNVFFFNGGTIYNYQSGYIEIDAQGALDNPSGGTVYNFGLINNGGTVTSSGSFINECTGQLTGTVNYPYTQTACVVVQVGFTTANSAPAGTISVSGCHASPTSITSDGSTVTITADGSCTLTFTVPSDGAHSRYRFSDGGLPSTTLTLTTCTSGTCPLATKTVYYQLENTFAVAMKDGNPNAGDTITLSGNFLGSSSSNILTLNVGGSPSASSTAWTDYGKTVTFPLNTAKSGSGERWAINGAYTTSPLTAGGNTYSQTYYHQFKIAFQYHTSDSSTPTSPTAYYTQFGSIATATATTSSPPSDWVDAGTSVSYANPTSGSTSERWQANYAISNGKSVIDSSVSSTGTLNPLYYHQFVVTFGYTTNDGTKIYSYTDLASYTQFGGTLYLSTDASGALSKTSDWVDAGSPVTYVSPVSTSSTERYQIDSSNSGTNTVISSVSSSTSANPQYYHQFEITFGYASQDTSTITSGARIGSYEHFGSSSLITAGATFGSTSPTSDWVDAGTGTVSYQTYTTGSGTERWALSSSPQSFDVLSSTTISEHSYYHQFDVSFAYTSNDGSTINSYTNLVTYSQFGGAMHLSTNSAGTLGLSNDWVDAATPVNYISPVLVTSGERYQIDSADTGTNTVIASVSSSSLASPEYYHQFLHILSYSVTGGGTPGAPDFSANGFGSLHILTLTLTPTAHWFDAGTAWTVSPNPLTGSDSVEQWYSTQTLAGYLLPSTVTTLSFTFSHQYAVTFTVSPSGAGTTSPSGNSIWENAGSLPVNAATNQGYSFDSWSATGQITFEDYSQSSTTATLNGPGTLTANFLMNTVITYSGASSGEYSDSVNLNATLTDSFGNALSGQTLTFTIGTQSVNAVTDSGGFASTTLLLDQMKGGYSVAISFNGDSTYAGSLTTNSFELSPEPATIEYTGTASISTSSTNGYVTLSAQVASELNDAAPPGSITNAIVTFYVYSSSNTLLYASSPTAVTETSPGVGTASLHVSCDSFGNTGCSTENTYVVYARIDSSTNNYYAASDSYNTLVVYTPNGQFVTLSGSIIDPNTGSLAHFGGTVRLAHHGVIQGSLIYMVTGACPTGVTSTNGLCDYQYRITSWAGGSLGFGSFGCAPGSTCYASFQGNGVLQVTDPVTGALLLSQGNIQITVGAWNNVGTSNNGGVDQFTMSVDYPQPVGSDTSYQVGTVSNPISFERGNIVVHST